MILAVLSAVAFAADVSVCSAGCDWDDLAGAVAAAADGDVLVIGDGLWRGQLVIERSLTLQAAPGARPVITDDFLQPLASAEALVVVRAPESSATPPLVRFEYLTIASSTRVALAVAGADVSLYAVAVSSTQSGVDGGTIAVHGGALHIDGGVFSGGSAVRGGLVFAGPGSAVTVAATGSAIPQFLNGTASEAGGAIFVEGEPAGLGASTLSIDGAFFGGNWSTGDGGAIAVRMVGNASIRADFRGNEAASGGAVSAFDSIVDLHSSHMSGNVALGPGGAVYTEYGELQVVDTAFALNDAAVGGAVASEWAVVGLVQRSTFCGNRARYTSGALHMTGVSTELAQLTVRSSAFYDNYAATQPAAIDLGRGEVRLHQNTLAANRSGSWRGSTVQVAAAVSDVRNNLFVGADGAVLELRRGEATLAYNGWWGNRDQLVYEEGTLVHWGTRGTDDQIGVDTGVEGDPLFQSLHIDGRCEGTSLKISPLGSAYRAGDPALADYGEQAPDLGAYGVDWPVTDNDSDECDSRYDCDDGDALSDCAIDVGACATRWRVDLDGDGFFMDEVSADLRDCVDEDASIHPGAYEVMGDRVDSNCDGLDAPPDQLIPYRACSSAPVGGASSPAIAALCALSLRRRRRSRSLCL